MQRWHWYELLNHRHPPEHHTLYSDLKSKNSMNSKWFLACQKCLHLWSAKRAARGRGKESLQRSLINFHFCFAQTKRNTHWRKNEATSINFDWCPFWLPVRYKCLPNIFRNTMLAMDAWWKSGIYRWLTFWADYNFLISISLCSCLHKWAH